MIKLLPKKIKKMLQNRRQDRLCESQIALNLEQINKMKRQLVLGQR